MARNKKFIMILPGFMIYYGYLAEFFARLMDLKLLIVE